MAKRIRAGGENEPVDESEEESLPPSSKKIKQSSQKHFTKLLSLLENDNSLIAGLTYFLNTVLKYDSSHEEVETGIELIHNYLNQFPECDHVLTPLEWDKEKRTFDVLFLCFKCLEQILLCTAPNLPQSSSTPQSKHLHSVGNRLVQQILANHLKCVYHSLRSNMPLRLVGSCLRLLTAMVMQGPESAKGLQLLFNFGYKPLAVFPNKTTSIADPISGHSESVRQSLMRFSLSFLVVGDADVITAVLQYKGFLSSFFTLLPKDEAENILVFLTTVFDKVVMNPEIAKKVKSLFFNQYVLKQTTMLLLEDHQLETPASSGDGDKHLETVKKVLDIAHRMIITLCTDFQVGICYKSKDLPAGLEKTNNPVLLHYLLFLSGHLEDPVAQELVFKTMSSCPDLLLSYLKSLALTFEPQPTSEWVVAMTFLAKLFGSFSSVPEILTGGSEDQPSQTLSDVAVGITTPLPVNRTYFNLGLQHPVPLVKHCTLQLINAVLKRASSVVDCWGPVNRNLHSITSFLVEYCDGVLKCLPDIRTIVSLYQRLQRDKGGTDPSTPSVKLEYLTAEDKLKNANLAGNSVLLSLTLQVLGGYQKLSPDIFTQVNFNPAKLLPSLLSHDSDKESCDPDILVLVLWLNLNVCNGRSWNQNRSAVSTSLLLTQSSDSVVSRISHALTRKILLSGEDGTAYHSDADVDVFLSCLSRTCLAHPEEKASLIEVASSAVVGSVSNRHQLREEVRELLEGDKSGEKMSLQQILELPNFDLADVSFKDCKKDVSRCEAASIRDCMRLNLLTCVLKEFRHDSVVLALIHDLMTHFLLISSLNECLSLVRLVLHHLPPSALKFSCSIPELYPLLDPKVCRELSDSHTVDQSELVPASGDSIPVSSDTAWILDPKVCRELSDSHTVDQSELVPASGDSIPVSSDTAWIQNLASKFRKSALKWNTFLVNTLRSEFKHDSALHLLSLLLPSIYGRRKRKSHTPLSTICDMIWSHSEFFNIMCSSCDQETAKESLVELLIAVVELDASVCKTAHMPVFLGSYSATRSKSDRGLLFLIHKYEENGINAGEKSPLLWGEASLERYGLKQDVYWHSLDLVEILKLLDSQKLIRSTGNFSIDTKLTPCNPYMEMDSSTRDLTLYDECFLLPLLSYYLDPDSRVDCRQFIRHGCLGYLLVALSSQCQDMRKAAGHCLTRFRTHLEENRFKEKAQIMLLLDVIQNTLAEKSARLPTIFAVFASKACHLFLHADSPVYSVVAHYIVHKPSLNVREIPLFYTMLHSSSIQAHNERIWLLRVLVDGLKCKEDYQFYRRYKVFSQVAALAGSSIPDRKTKTVAMELLKTYNSYDSGRHKFIYNFQHC